MAGRLAALLCALSLVCAPLGEAAAEETIGYLFKDKIEDNIPVKVYIKEVANQSGQKEIAPEAFRKELAASLHERRSIKFEVLDKAVGSDIEISAVIKNYQYMERGPFKPNPGIGTMVLEAAATATQNYAEIAVEYTVTDFKTGKTLWENTVKEYIKKNMTPEESVPLVYDAVTRAFVWKCFGKANLRNKNRGTVM